MRSPWDRRENENVALATSLLVGVALLTGSLAIPAALFGDPGPGPTWGGTLLWVSALTGVVVYLEHLPTVVSRLWRSIRAPFSDDVTVDTGPILLGLELVGVVLAGIGIAGVFLFFQHCGIGVEYRCTSFAEDLGLGGPVEWYRLASAAVFYLGGGVLAVAWVAEGLSVTADRGDGDEPNAVDRFR